MQNDPDPVEWRFEQFKKYEFTDEQAMVLSYTKDFKGFPIYHEDVARMLERAKSKYEDEEKARNIVFDLLS